MPCHGGDMPAPFLRPFRAQAADDDSPHLATVLQSSLHGDGPVGRVGDRRRFARFSRRASHFQRRLPLPGTRLRLHKCPSLLARLLLLDAGPASRMGKRERREAAPGASRPAIRRGFRGSTRIGHRLGDFLLLSHRFTMLPPRRDQKLLPRSSNGRGRRADGGRTSQQRRFPA